MTDWMSIKRLTGKWTLRIELFKQLESNPIKLRNKKFYFLSDHFRFKEFFKCFKMIFVWEIFKSNLFNKNFTLF